MLTSYVWRDLVRNPRRSLATLAGIALGVGLFSAVLFFIDGSSASMTQRAIAPLPIDMQRVLTAPLGGQIRLRQDLDATGPLAAGDTLTVHLELVNDSATAANEVVLRSDPPRELAYVPGSATRDGTRIEPGRSDNPLAQGDARTGFNLGTIASGGRVTVEYRVVVQTPANSARDLQFRTSFSSREIVKPVRANAPEAVGLQDLANRISGVDGIASADVLSIVDLPRGSLSAGATAVPGAVRLFAFDTNYRQRHDAIAIVRGSQIRDQALISVEAASVLGVGVGDRVMLKVPGASAALELTVSGIADLSRARALFYSRQGSNLEDFLYAPISVVLDPAMFDEKVIPAYRAASTTRGDLLKNLPIREVDIQVDRRRLDAEPGTAVEQTRSIATAVMQIAAEQDYLIDNVSNTLDVAREDAGVAKRMFVFLGVPGATLAAILAAYAGAVLASAQRREQAVLRLRGAHRGHLFRMLAIRSTLLSAAGSVIGLVVGLLSALAVLGIDALARASVSSLLASGLLGIGGGFVATSSALYIAGSRSIRRGINEEHARLASHAPVWQRMRLDMVAIIILTVLTAAAVRGDAFRGIPGSVYNGRGVNLNLLLLALPIGAWVAGCLLIGRAFAHGISRLPTKTASFAHLVRGVLTRSLRRRSWAATEGMIVLALIVGAGTSIASFTASYDRAKAADARFVVGSDIRVSPSPTAGQRPGSSYTTELQASAGIGQATPVVFGIQNAVIRSAQNEDAANVAAVEPSTFLRVAALDDRNFLNLTAEQALSAMAADPTGAFLSTTFADFISVQPGDPIRILFARGTDQQAMSEMHVIGLFERLPAFPQGADALVSIAHQQQIVASTQPDFFLARTSDPSAATLALAVANLRTGPGSARPLTIETRETALDKDQSSLAALNIRGLLTLDSSYALAMATVAITIFVFGLLLQRRREYVTMRAQGLQAADIRRLIVAETSIIAVCGSLAGIGVGMAMAYFLVNVLRPLFVVAPAVAFPVGGIITFAILLFVSTIVTSFAATGLINRLRPTELLRDE